ncbi:phosphatidate cytidylyltransferase [Luteococcus sanguinis]|uniref:Phosphatidate cytidylyltransferase n=1 Tax=Luteococcus sanguinis TaxID=174038 RepID=A0ABW1WWW4_9ACTN
MSQQKISPTDVNPVPRPSRAGRNLPAAIAVGVVLISAVIATLAWWHWGFILLVAAALSMGVVEVSRALSRIGMHAATAPVFVGTLAVVLGSYYAGQHPAQQVPSNTLILGLLALTSLACLVWRLREGPENYVRDAAASLFLVGYIPLLGSAVALMMAADDGPARIVTFILCVVASDTGGYIAGVLFGKHKMAPTVSPKKTWEGFAGSVLFGVGIGIACSIWLLGVGWYVGLLLGVLLVAVGTAGDLVESMIKRDAGIKDMSSFLPGHGGIMDRLDSLLVAAPVAWALLFLLVPVA